MSPGSSSKSLMVGTAGHVDHGKTALIKAMTGINTDRLKEEQERGLTIDLGFAHLSLPGGREIGIIDVPGHERFLKNMLAGASGIDIALLVVAADEGVMPQTREHLDILELLETRLGVVALTKCDLAEADWIDMVEEDLRDTLNDTFLGSSRIVRVSSVTGEGMDNLVAEIDRLSESAEQRRIEGPFRLPIDRVFTITGFGTIVTGTLVSGTLRVGDPVVILPAGIETRIRGLEVHGEKQQAVSAARRTAVNLAGVEVDDISRGDVLLPPGYLQAATCIDASVQVLPDSPWPLKTQTRVRFHVGTAEVLGRVTVLAGEEIGPGKKGFVQLKLESPVVAARGDRFVLRFYSPMYVLGGGAILDSAAPRHRRNDSAVIARLERKLKGDPVDLIDDTLSLQEAGATRQELIRTTGLIEQEVEQALSGLAEAGRAFEAAGRWMHRAAFDSVAARAVSALEAYHKANNMKPGMPKEELRAALGPRIDQKGFQALLAAMTGAGTVAVVEAAVKLPGHQPTLTAKQQDLVDRIGNEYHTSGMNPPLAGDLEQKHGKDTRQIVAMLAERGELVKIAPELYFHHDAIELADKALRAHLAARGQITVSEFRDVIGSSRKYAIPLLEHFDDKKVTRRSGDVRVLA